MTAEIQGRPIAVGADYRNLDLGQARLPETGYLRLYQIIGSRKTNPPTPPLVPVGRSTWHAGVKSGRFPQPVRGLGKRITAWRVEDILALIDRLNEVDGKTTVAGARHD